MKVQYNNDGQKRASKTKRRRRKGVGKMIYVYFAVVLIGVLLTLSYTVWFEVTKVTVTGGSIYDNDEVLMSSQIYIGDNLVRLSKSTISERIEKQLPYVKKAEVVKNYPHTVKIKITDDEETVAVKFEGKYYIADDDFKLLKVADEKPEGLPIISGVSAEGLKPGDHLAIKDKQQRESLDRIFALNKDGLDVTYVSIKNTLEDSDYSTYDICVGGRLYVELGDSNNLDRKLTHLETMMESITDNGTALISLVDWSVTNKRAVLRYEDISSYIDD